ncbi:MAG: type III secretion system cytoplasmic ring protein SctQ [Hyphomicrobiaceae bacterium]|nr:type III secretion system cytoplasmic ring protein SctQ [Hyphomicrobiaceae bacterium]
MVERMPLSLTLDPMLVGGAPDASGVVGGPAFELIWSIGAQEHLIVTLPEKIVAHIARAVEPSLGTVPDDPARSFLVELALAPLLDTLEGRLGTNLTLLETLPAEATSHGADALPVRGEIDGLRFAASLRMVHNRVDGVPAIERLASLLRLATPRHSAGDTFLASITVSVAFRAGTMRVRLRALRALAPGDVLIPDEFPLSHDEVLVIAAGRLRALARLEDRGARLQAALRPIRREHLELGQMNDDVNSTPPDLVDGLDEVEVVLSFELGRLNVELRELKSIGPGYVFALGRDPAHAIDIVVNGRKIGKGEIVKIGETIGVRTTRLYGGE